MFKKKSNKTHVSYVTFFKTLLEHLLIDEHLNYNNKVRIVESVEHVSGLNSRHKFLPKTNNFITIPAPQTIKLCFLCLFLLGLRETDVKMRPVVICK